MERGDGFGGEAAGLEIPADTALPTGPLATDNVESDNGRLPASSNAQPGMNEGNREAQEEDNRLGAAGGGGRPLVTQESETVSISSADREESIRLIRERRRQRDREDLLRQNEKMEEWLQNGSRYFSADQIRR